ncbi:hypothetical protein [Amycolatopsis azurea]|uniref:Uncharacterized protein n=1 Tax=Amycolatopsis azurea DSM 43854 TaxID=1238180 RepID=M2Q7K0_9PSEU|nr:hypothetical protein [Amycolatopsis azurea]EMD22716.1 hypothetical protein C791_8040 [Amycolatopsis azurea DSM 43854]OOC00867.1 hypothetical protein B0293_41040 [Amycolatopsis azurea DSM 43854]
MSDPVEVIVFRDEPGEFAEMAPDFVAQADVPPTFESLAVQWPEAAGVEEKQRFLRFVATATGEGRSRVARPLGKLESDTEADGLASFLGAVDGDSWWVGDVAIEFDAGDSTEMIWFPGSDGVFLHIGAAASLLDFTVIPAFHEIAIVLDWQLTVQ